MDFTVISLAGLTLCAVFFAAGMMDAICGGGGLISMPVFLAVGFPVHYISGTSQCANCPGSFMAFAKYAKSGKIQWLSAFSAVPTAILGALLGARLNVCLSEEILEGIMLILVPVVAAIMIFNRDFGRGGCLRSVQQKSAFLALCTAGVQRGAVSWLLRCRGGDVLYAGLCAH